MQKAIKISIILFLILNPILFSESYESFSYYPYELSWYSDGSQLLGLTVLGLYSFTALADEYDHSSGAEQQDLHSNDYFQLNQINGFDRFFWQPYNSSLNSVSNFLVFFAVGAGGVGTIMAPTLSLSQRVITFGMYSEVILWILDIQFLIKYLSPRYRPYNYDENTPLELLNSENSWQSFPSGHTMYAFAGATFLHSLYNDLYPGQKKWPLIGAYSLAGTVAALRVASGKHFATDVMAGAAIGGAIGWIIPHLNSYFYKRRRNGPVSDSSALLDSIRLVPISGSAGFPSVGLLISY